MGWTQEEIGKYLCNLKNQNLSNIIPIKNVKSEEDIIKYNADGYEVMLYEQCREQFPELIDKYGDYLYYANRTDEKIMYFDEGKGIIFYTGIFVGSDDNGVGLFYLDFMYKVPALEHVEFLISDWEKMLSEHDFDGMYFAIPEEYRVEYTVRSINTFPEEYRYSFFIDMYSGADYGFGILDESFLQYIKDSKTQEQIDSTMEELDNAVGGDILHVYRGIGEMSTENGFSFTLDEDTAYFFAERFSGNGDTAYIIEADVYKKDVIEYITDRDEEEILVLPSTLMNVQKYEYDIEK